MMGKSEAGIKEKTQRLDTILNKARQEKPLKKEEIIFILQLRQKEHIDSLFRTARSLRRKY